MRTILVVEDDANVLRLLSISLSDLTGEFRAN